MRTLHSNGMLHFRQIKGSLFTEERIYQNEVQTSTKMTSN